jgi:glycosyltransferase involved in cell wall biosynthesis
MKLSIVVPVYNEKNTIREIINRIRSAPVANLQKEIIVVDDFSTDGTRELLENELSSLVDQVLYQEKNKGKGAALRTGFSHATGEVVVVQDADLEYNPAEFDKLLQPIISNRADVVYGSRFVGSEPHRVLYFWHYMGNKLLTLLSNMFTNLNLTDMETCYKMFRNEVLQSVQIEQNRFGFEPEITAKVARGKWRVYEVGISYSGRSYEEGKKINWRDGVHALWCILKYNIGG